MAKGENRKINQFDEKSDKHPKQKKVVEKIDFNSLSYDEKLEYVKKNFELGLTSEQLDFYSKEILKQEIITGKPTNHKKAPKPKTEKRQTTKKQEETVTKDLNELANIKIEEGTNPEQEETAIEQAIETGEAKVEEATEQIQTDRKKGEEKAEILGGEEGKASLSEDLEPIKEKEQSILYKIKESVNEPENKETPEELKKKRLSAIIDELKKENENLTTEGQHEIFFDYKGKGKNAIPTRAEKILLERFPEYTKKETNKPVNTEEILNSINELKAGIDELKKEGEKEAKELKELQDKEKYKENPEQQEILKTKEKIETIKNDLLKEQDKLEQIIAEKNLKVAEIKDKFVNLEKKGEVLTLQELKEEINLNINKLLENPEAKKFNPEILKFEIVEINNGIKVDTKVKLNNLPLIGNATIDLKLDIVNKDNGLHLHKSEIKTDSMFGDRKIKDKLNPLLPGLIPQITKYFEEKLQTKIEKMQIINGSLHINDTTEINTINQEIEGTKLNFENKEKEQLEIIENLKNIQSIEEEKLHKLENPEEEFLRPISLDDETEEELKPFSLEKENKKKKEKPKIDIDKVRKIAEQKMELMAITEGRDLTDEEKFKITREVFSQEKELFNKNQSEKAGRFRKGLNAAWNWWLGIDNKGNKLEQSIASRSAKVALATAITSVGAFLTSDVSRLVTRVGFATGVSTIINTALASNKVKEILSGFSKDKNAEEDKKLVQKYLTTKNIIGGLSVGTVFALSGPIMAIVAGGGIVSRELINYYFDKNIPESQEEIKKLNEELEKNDDNFDINKFINKLDDIEKLKKELVSDIRWDARLKSVLNTTLTAGVGFASYQVATAEYNIENTEQTTQETVSEEEVKGGDKNNFVRDNKNVNEKSFWDKVKNWNPLKRKTETNTITMGEDEYETPEENTVNSETEQTTQETVSDENVKPTEENVATENTNVGTKKAPEVKTDKTVEQNTPETKTTKTEIPKEAIIDGKERVGITYALRDQLKTNKELADYFKIDQAKLDDAKYVAKVTKELAIKFGYMDNEGHEIRISEDGKNNIAYVLKLNADGKPEIHEMDVETGKSLETHGEGYNFEAKDHEEHEYFEDKKYSYQKTDNEVTPGEAGGEDYPKPEKIAVPKVDYVDPDALKEDEIVPPEKLVKIETYTYANIDKSPIWEKIKEGELKDFFAIGKSNMDEEQLKVAEYLRDQYKVALQREPRLEQYIEQNPNMTLKQANELYNNVIKGNYKPIDLGIEEEKTINSDSLIEKLKGDQESNEIRNIADKFEYKIDEKDLAEIKKVNNQNINKIFEKNKDEWYKLKDFSARKYMKITNEGKLSNYLDQLRRETGLKPKNGFIGLGKKEQIDEYITRCLLEAQKNGKLDLIKPIIEEEFDIEKMKPASQ